MHPRLHPVPGLSGNGQKLDAVSEFARIPEVIRSQTVNALAVDALKRNRNAEGDGDQDRQLVSRVRAVHIQRWGIFRVTQVDGFLHRLVIGKSLLGHAREDVVGRPVQNSHDRPDPVGGEALSQGPDDRDSAADARFKGKADAMPFGSAVDLLPVFRKESLVRRDHVLPFLQGQKDVVLGLPKPSDELNHDVDLRVVDDLHRIPCEEITDLAGFPGLCPDRGPQSS